MWVGASSRWYYWSPFAIDATMPFGRKHEFERKKIPGVDRINLRDWIA